VLWDDRIAEGEIDGEPQFGAGKTAGSLTRTPG
jgi:hypothetical protein